MQHPHIDSWVVAGVTPAFHAIHIHTRLHPRVIHGQQDRLVRRHHPPLPTAAITMRCG